MVLCIIKTMPVVSEPERALVMQWPFQHLDHGFTVTSAHAKSGDIWLLWDMPTHEWPRPLPFPTPGELVKTFVL